MRLILVKCLYNKYSKDPEQYYINLDCRDGIMWADCSSYDFEQLDLIYRRMVLRWMVPNHCSPDDLMESIAKKAERLLNCFSEHDGRGSFTKEGEDIIHMISVEIG